MSGPSKSLRPHSDPLPIRPRAARECHVLLIEPRGVVNAGDAGGERAAPGDIWV